MGKSGRVGDSGGREWGIVGTKVGDSGEEREIVGDIGEERERVGDIVGGESGG